MADLKTFYAGLELKNPLIVGASNLVTDIDKLISLEKVGAAAIVYKSLFEEQIQLERSLQEKLGGVVDQRSARYPVPDDHLIQLKKAKQVLTIPLIGSLNCISKEAWVEYAVKMAETGIDALELNFYSAELGFGMDGPVIEESQLTMLGIVKRSVTIPVTVKLSPFYTNPLWLISEMDRAGADGFVLFNRLFQPDIDIQKEEHHFPYNFSSENDNRLALRYAGLLYGKVRGSICCNTGIHSGRDIIKMLLAGADTVQVVSAIYRNGIHHIIYMLEEMEAWMEQKNYANIEAFRGKLSKDKLKDPFAYKRAQYVDILMRTSTHQRY